MGALGRVGGFMFVSLPSSLRQRELWNISAIPLSQYRNSAVPLNVKRTNACGKRPCTQADDKAHRIARGFT